MSPLLDVTNTVTPDLLESVEVSARIRPSDGVDEGSGKQNSSSPCAKTPAPSQRCSGSGAPSGNSRRYLKRKKIKNGPDFKNFSLKLPEFYGSNSVRPAVSLQCGNGRVPPVFTVEFLSSAIETLKISNDKSGHKDSLPTLGKIPGDVSKVASAAGKETHSLETLAPNENPQNDGGCSSSTYQCIACGLELSSLSNLTTHLIKHIYEGLHAAAWLNNTMCTLLQPPLPPNTSSTASSVDILPEDKPTAEVECKKPNEELTTSSKSDLCIS